MPIRGSAFLAWKSTDKMPGGTLYFDAVMSETLEETSTITEFPVEVGVNTSDHVRENPEKLTLDVIVSNTPLFINNNVDEFSDRGALGKLALSYPDPPQQYSLYALIKAGMEALKSLFGSADKPSAMVNLYDSVFSAVIDTRQILNQLRQEGHLIDISSRDWFLSNMVVVAVMEPRTIEDGSTARLSIVFQKLRIVETKQTLAAVPAEPRGQGKIDAGKKGGGTAATKKVALDLMLARALGAGL